MKCIQAFALVAAYRWSPACAFSAHSSSSSLDLSVDQQQQQQQQHRPSSEQDNEPAVVVTTSFSRTIQADSQKVEETWQAKLDRLWNDPRPFTEAFDGDVAIGDNDVFTSETLPYRLTSGTFDIHNQTFECILYPRGILNREAVGSAAAYLRYHAASPGDEVDMDWTLRLINGRTGEALPLFTSGGLPRSNDTWSSAMTFTSNMERVDSLGRTGDWGSSTWFTDGVVEALGGPGGNLIVEGNVTIHNVRSGENSFSFPPGQRGAVGAAIRSVQAARDRPRTFRAGEVVVPTDTSIDAKGRLEHLGIFPGVDYRVMTIADARGKKIFSTDALSTAEDQNAAKLALRPVGWRLHQQMWQQRGIQVTDWPVEIEAGVLSETNALTRFNPGAFLPRLRSLIARDAAAFVLFLFVGLSPILLSLVGREVVSFYEIPSASMDPTLQKGDVLLVEKLPGAFERTKRGDVILFKPPPTLQEIIGARAAGGGSASQGKKKAGFGSGVNPLGGQSLFVKRVVGMPGDVNIQMDEATKDVFINGDPAVGPRRDLCEDEPLRLIDRLLKDGKGKSIEELGNDEAYVLGDCKGVSVDSRVFGTLPKDNIVGRPIARIWPPKRFGGSL
mmetsp:Transcript_2730/g.8024  ORF Transcript_2730/g.8024 Transcript_2730/m.8024 type:complete len:614 (-) Transcript_2730:90-1931(-)